MDETYNKALKYSGLYKGKIEVAPKVPIKSLKDFAVYYTPGAAAVSKKIFEEPNLSFELTGRWNMVAIVTDGSRVLGLGNVGAEASYPVMEGKALLFKFLGGVDAIPIPLKTQDKEEIVEVIKKLEPAFGGINLEGIESPKCFYILERLKAELKIPVWHDDQLGTAGVILAALINVFKLTNKDFKNSKIVLVGAGAANIATCKLLISAGVPPGKIILVDSKGILHPERMDMDELMLKNPWKYELAIKTNEERIQGGFLKH